METLSYIYFKDIIRTKNLHNDNYNINEVPILPQDELGYSNAFIYPDVKMYSYVDNEYSYYTSYSYIINKISYDIDSLEHLEVDVTSYLNDYIHKVDDIMNKHKTQSNKYYNIYSEFPTYNENTKYTIGDINKVKRYMKDEDHFKQQ